MTANELLALVMPGNRVDRLENDRQEVEGQCFRGMEGHAPPSPLLYSLSHHQRHKVHGTIHM